MYKLIAVLFFGLCTYVNATEITFYVQSTNNFAERSPMSSDSWIAIDFDNLTARGQFYFPSNYGVYYRFAPDVVAPSYLNPHPQSVTFDAATGLFTMNSYYEPAFSGAPPCFQFGCVAFPDGDISLSLIIKSDKTGFISSSPSANSRTFWGVNPTSFELHSDLSNVPTPAAAWLFGSSLISLVGAARRKYKVA